MSRKKPTGAGKLTGLLDSWVPETPAEAPQEARKAEPVTVRLPPDLVNRARDVVFGTPGLTLNALLEAALVEEVRRREEANGGPFPPRPQGQRLTPPVRK